jgi:hypothetical protein
MVIAAPRIELRPAGWALIVALKILPNTHLHAASPAQNRLPIPFALRPNFYRMSCQRIVAILASKVSAATFHPDGDNIDSLSIMSAPALRVHVDSVHCRASMWHDHRVI